MQSDFRITCWRLKILDEARDLAGSGEYADHTSIVEALRQMEGFEFAEKRMQDYAFLEQLDQMCRMARDAHTPVQEDGKHA